MQQHRARGSAIALPQPGVQRERAVDVSPVRCPRRPAQHPPPGLVLVAVPSVRHSSVSCTPSSALDYRKPRCTPNGVAADNAVPGRRSITSPVPAAVPSLFRSSEARCRSSHRPPGTGPGCRAWSAARASAAAVLTTTVPRSCQRSSTCRWPRTASNALPAGPRLPELLDRLSHGVPGNPHLDWFLTG
jgi:hypothetical protein